MTKARFHTLSALLGVAALVACDLTPPTSSLTPGPLRPEITYDTASLTQSGYLFETAFTVPMGGDNGAVSWVSTGITLYEGDRVFIIPDGQVSYTLNDYWVNWCDTHRAEEWPWWCNVRSGSADLDGGIPGPSGNTDDDLRLFYRINRPGA